MNKKYNIHIMFDNHSELEIQVDHEDTYPIKTNEIWSFDHYQLGEYYIATSKIVYITFWEIDME